MTGLSAMFAGTSQSASFQFSSHQRSGSNFSPVETNFSPASFAARRRSFSSSNQAWRAASMALSPHEYGGRPSVAATKAAYCWFVT